MLTRISILVFVALLCFSCTDDKVSENAPDCPSDPITYDADVRLILNTYCAYSGCHDGGFRPEDFTSYDAMLPWLTPEKFEQEIISLDMPPLSASPGLTELSPEEFETIECWIEQGYLEN